MARAFLSVYRLPFFVFVLFLSCKKSADNRGGSSNDDDIYIVSAPKIINMVANDWNNVEPELSNKTGYIYTEFTEDQDSIFKAVPLLPAIDDSNNTVHSYVLINVRRSDNKITFARTLTNDTLSKLNKSEAYAMMLNYNNETSKLLTGIIDAHGHYDNSTTGTNITVEDMVTKLNSGFDALVLTIHYEAIQGYFDMSIYKQNNGSYIFLYQGAKF